MSVSFPKVTKGLPGRAGIWISPVRLSIGEYLASLDPVLPVSGRPDRDTGTSGLKRARLILTAIVAIATLIEEIVCPVLVLTYRRVVDSLVIAREGNGVGLGDRGGEKATD